MKQNKKGFFFDVAVCQRPLTLTCGEVFTDSIIFMALAHLLLDLLATITLGNVVWTRATLYIRKW